MDFTYLAMLLLSNMHKMCRLCVSSSEDNLTELRDNKDVLVKIRSFSGLEIPLKRNLPYKICKKCKCEVDHCYAFNQLIQKNEQKIIHHFEHNNGALEEFLKSLKNGKMMGDDKQLKVSIIEDCTDFQENAINILNSNKPKSSTNAGCIKMVPDEHSFNYSSEDDISLSALKTQANKKKSICTDLKTNNGSINPNLSRQDTTFSREEPTSFESTQENKEWKCLTCENLFTSRAVLLEHYKTVHGATNESKTMHNYTRILSPSGYNYQCGVCEKVYDKKKDMRRHMITHEEARPYDCSLCGRKYKTAADIVRHARAHTGVKTLACAEGCGFRTVYRSALLNHENRHKTKFKFTCEQCGKGFQVRTWFEQHRNLHTGDRPYLCDHCGKGFHMERYLAVHRSKQHAAAMTAERHYCVHCAFTCASRHALTLHLKEQHDIAAIFLCDICGRSLATAEYLKYHRRTHLGEKPHACSICDKAFVKKCNLTLHQRTHSGERPHVCATCGKAFAQRGALMLHTRYHTGTRPYQCTKCQKAFYTNNQLTTHKRSC